MSGTTSHLRKKAGRRGIYRLMARLGMPVLQLGGARAQ